MNGLMETQILKPGTRVRIGQDEYVVMGNDREEFEEDLNDLNYYLLAAGKTPEFDAWYDVMTLWTDIEVVLCTCCHQWHPLESIGTIETPDAPEGRAICSDCLSAFDWSKTCPYCGDGMALDRESEWNHCDSCGCHLCDSCVTVTAEERIYCPDCEDERE